VTWADLGRHPRQLGANLGQGVALDAGLDREGWNLKTSESTGAASSSATGMVIPGFRSW
jgi:hypothetical protein